MKVLIVFYSMYGHVYKMAQAVAEGVRASRRRAGRHATGAGDISGGGPAENGRGGRPKNVCQRSGMQRRRIALGRCNYFRHTYPLRQHVRTDAAVSGRHRTALGTGALVGKVGSVFASSATQHGGQESTLLCFHITLLHQGMVVVGLPYAFSGQMRNDEITGCSPYGATTIAGTQGERSPTENELAGARFQGKHVAAIAAQLAK